MIDRIKKIMESKQINAAQFADEIGVQRSALSHVLSGRNNPSLDFMLKVKSAYSEINLDWLLIGSGTMMENLAAEKPKPLKQDKFELEIEFPDKDSQEKKETSLVEPAKKPAKPTESIKTDTAKSESRIPKQVILLFDDNTFQLFDTT